MLRRATRPSPAMVVALFALFIALGGASYAALSLAPNTVGTAQIKRSAVTLPKISAHARKALKGKRGPQGIQGNPGQPGPATGPASGDLAGSYPAPTIKAGAVTADKLAPSPSETPVTPESTTFTQDCSGGTATGQFCSHWMNAGGAYGPGSFYRDNQGVVHLGGVVSYAAVDPTNHCDAAGFRHIIFFLPVGSRPAAQKVFAVESADANGRVDVMPDGSVVCRAGDSTTYVSLDGITFRASG